MMRWLCLLSMLVLCTFARASQAQALSQTLEAPIGGAAIPVGAGLVACAGSGGWTLEAGGTQLRPPTAETAAGTVVSVRVAPSFSGCAASKQQLLLLATGRFPVLDATSVTLFVDEARVEAHGRNLKGTIIRWLGAGHSGNDSCPEPKTEPNGNGQSCGWVVGRDLSADPSADTLRLLPPFAQVGEGQRLFDALGQPLPPDGLPLPAAHIVIGRLLGTETAIDLSMGRTELSLVHPEAVAGADCALLDCAFSAQKLTVSSTAPVSSAELRL
ncbi:MAG TPA: hypothetical protein VEQ58_00720, partial [Polyangiaceae bacterium]|nr:hypothetical protein [Polyangiaceae bacterium]